MLKHYFKLTTRHLLKQKVISIIMITGLVIGFTCFFIAALSVSYELSFDSFHENSGNIYRLVNEFKYDNYHKFHPNSPAPLKQLLDDEIAGIEKSVRFSTMQAYTIISSGNHQYHNLNITLSDPEFFEVFDAKFIQGSPAVALSDMHSVVVTESLAMRIFGETNVLGKSLIITESKDVEYSITGVIKDMPTNSSIQFDCLCPFPKNIKSWSAWNFQTYVLLNENTSSLLVAENINKAIKKYINDDEDVKIHMQSLRKIHVNPNWNDPYPTVKSTQSLYILGFTGFIILLIACLNYIILSNANSKKREKEIYIKKFIGARKNYLLLQYQTESIAIVSIAAFIALIVTEKTLFLYNRFFSTELSIDFQNLNSYLFFFGLVFTIGALSGAVPAITFSKTNISQGLRGGYSGQQKKRLNHVLVIAQFVASIIFIVCSLTISYQLKYMSNKDLGLEKENILIVPLHEKTVADNYCAFANELQKSPLICNTSATSYLPGGMSYHQNVSWDGLPKTSLQTMDFIPTDVNFVKLLNLKIIAGHDFYADNEGEKSYILNQKAVNEFELQNPIGKPFDISGPGRIIGIVEDFNYKSLHLPVNPCVLCVIPDTYRYLYIKITNNQQNEGLKYVKEQWLKFFPENEFSYSYFTDHIKGLYKDERRQNSMVLLLSILSVLISCMGIFGLTLLSLESRIKEFGIRKTNGARSKEVYLMLSKDFTKWIALAYIIACPVAWYAMHKWLQNFAYKTQLSWWIFAFAGLMALGIAMLTVSWQSWRAARRNPVEALRYE